MFSDLFEIDRLTSVQAIDDALGDFEYAVDKYSLERALRELIEDKKSHLLPLLFSNIRDLGDWIIETFPIDPQHYATSLHHKLLLDLSGFFLISDALQLQQGDADLSFQHRVIPKVPDLINSICALEFVNDPNVDSSDMQFAKRSQKQQKKSKRAEMKSKALDENLLRDLNLNIKPPQNKQDADDAVLLILAHQKTFLQSYLDSLRLEDVANKIKASSVFVLDDTQPLQVDSTTEVSSLGETVSAPSVYPKVQPLKSALYFDSVTDFGAWTILINQNAHNDLRVKYKKEKASFDIIVKKIKELSNGHFSPDNQKRLKGVDFEVPIFEAKMTGDLRLVVMPTGDEQEQQAIKVFGIYTHAQMDDRLWGSIGKHLGRKGKVYRERCSRRIRVPHSDEHTFMPELFPPLPELAEEMDPQDLLTDDTDPVHSRFLMEKYVVFSQPLLNTILADVEATFPHLVSSQEKAIIEHPYSCYVVGRSGTGKTTTLLFKMLLIERTFQLAAGDAPKPRQIFVTQSRILAKKVEQYFSTLVKSLSATNQSLDELRQLRASRKYLEDDEDMIDVDDILDWSGDLPNKFSELRDEHFPLFTTFNGLCSMIEADMASTNSAKKTTRMSASTKSLPNASQRVALTYDGFLRDYWPHFAQSSVKHLDPALVFSEFLGVIKGSEETLNSNVHYLTSSEYRNMSARNQSTFAENRDNLYALFRAYLGMKKMRGEVDGADRQVH
ncbi:hypothetical protein VKT23_006556 [Stygiomarasmius scandens]|uniref:UvrD-like helicase ATP-binding domain-containing protein n=1 Tax=Marasmiellus scandens TaxID=2682957 RepID=A0ABR1JQZ9_9AGAR